MTEPVSSESRPTSLLVPTSRPVVTWVLLAVIIAVFGLQTLLGGSTDTETLIRLGAKVAPLVADGDYWRLFTSMFLHIGLMHLFFNGYALIIVGTELERLYGSGRFLSVYLLSGLYGSLTSYAFSTSLSAGASGAIFGLIGALAAFFGLYRQRLGSWGQRRLANVLFLIVINLILGFTQPGIDNLAHTGGLVCGLALGWALVPRYAADPVAHKLVDQNRLGRYWPALALAILLFVGGTILATAIQRDSAQSHIWRAEQAIEQEAWDEVVFELEQAVAKDPSVADAEILFYLGLAYYHLDQPQLAAEAYESALTLAPDDAASHWNLALIYLELARFTEARTHFETYQTLNPDQAAEAEPWLQYLDRLSP